MVEVMYSWEKSLREEKARKNPKNPSFSSTLLDEIYRSIDGNDEKSAEELRVCRERSVKKYGFSSSNGGVRAKVEDEDMVSLKRACMIEKWMEKKVHDKVSSRRRPSSLPETDNKTLFQDSDPLFFSSTSSSSDSSSGGLSSSDTEFFSSSRSRKSCFVAPWPKPVRTSVSRQQGDHEFHMFDEYQNQQATKDQESFIKSKSRALKIYANLKKVKQPISPGGRLTSFINSLFTNGSTKKSKNRSANGGYEDAHIERTSKSTQESTCSSASSFSRSCLSKTPPSSRGKTTDGTKRTVRFYPVSVIVDEDCRPCGHKCIYDADSNKYGRPPLPQNAKEQKLHHTQTRTTKIEGVARETLRTYQNQKKVNFTIDRTISREEEEEEDDDFDDAASDSSSDLFEIDHLSLFGNERFREELPVYETTHLDTNLAIASGLIR